VFAEVLFGVDQHRLGAVVMLDVSAVAHHT
jgi:hypothetical protein